MLHQDGFVNQPWVRWRIKDGDKGPMVWEAKLTCGFIPSTPLACQARCT